MSKYADWSPASVFGSTAMPCKVSARLSSLSPTKPKTSPKKRNSTVNSRPQNVLETNNNDELDGDNSEIVQRLARVSRDKNLAALLLQRQFQVWLLRRQENLRVHEVQSLREKLQNAAANVIRESYCRYIKRRAISSYLRERENFEMKLADLLQNCINRKRQLEAALRFATFRRQLKQQAENRKRKLVHQWIVHCIHTRRQKRGTTIVRAHEKLLGWVRRWKVRKRCEARAISREKEKQTEARRRSSAQTIFAIYRAYKLCCSAKNQLRQRIRMRDGLVALYNTFETATLRIAQSRWRARVSSLKMAEDAAKTLQCVYRARLDDIKHARRVKCCLVLQSLFRGHRARVNFAKVRRIKHQEIFNRQRQAAAIEIQRHVRGYFTRIWFGEVLCKLRERFKCVNCGAVEPGGTYCKYCGRHRTTIGSLASVMLLHERRQLGRPPSPLAVKNSTAQDTPVLVDDFSPSPPIVPSPNKPMMRSRSASLRVLAVSSSSIEFLDTKTPLPIVMPPLHRHRRVVLHKAGTFSSTRSLSKALPIPRRSSISSISEQTALRAAALATLQTNMTASIQASTLQLHLTRLQKANKAIHRGENH